MSHPSDRNVAGPAAAPPHGRAPVVCGPRERTWEAAVRWLRDQADQEALVRACYYDDPLLAAAQRFADSDEWHALRTLLPVKGGNVLDLGAGRGISSYALARDGWSVTAVEPDRSALVGAAAIHALSKATDPPIRVVQGSAEALPFADRTFDLVNGRQVLHHARDLRAMCREVARVLRPGGRFIATREHVINRPQDLAAFLEAHPLHRYYGGEHAHLLSAYTEAIRTSGLTLSKVMGPFDSPINYFPVTTAQLRALLIAPLARVLGARAAGFLTSERHWWGRWCFARIVALRTALATTPGRLYSFVADRPPV